MKVNVGNQEGQYFRQWRFDELLYVARQFEQRLAVEMEFDLFYDQIHDYHHLVFKYNGHDVNIRFYKVFSSLLNGKDDWSACQQSYIDEAITSLVKKLRIPATTEDKVLDFAKNGGIRFAMYTEEGQYLSDEWQTALPEVGAEIEQKNIRYAVVAKHKILSVDAMNHKIMVDKTPTWKAVR